MKKLLLTMFFLAGIVLGANAQVSSFTHTAECNLKQSELYSRTKRFISAVWKSPNKSIQNDDREGGSIAVDASITKIHKQLMMQCEYDYTFRVEFRMKDGKYRIEIRDLQCVRAEQVSSGSVHKIPLIQPFGEDNVPEKTKSLGKGISKKKAIEMMAELRDELQSLVEAYIAEMSKEDDF